MMAQITFLHGERNGLFRGKAAPPLTARPALRPPTPGPSATSPSRALSHNPAPGAGDAGSRSPPRRTTSPTTAGRCGGERAAGGGAILRASGCRRSPPPPAGDALLAERRQGRAGASALRLVSSPACGCGFCSAGLGRRFSSPPLPSLLQTCGKEGSRLSARVPAAGPRGRRCGGGGTGAQELAAGAVAEGGVLGGRERGGLTLGWGAGCGPNTY